MGDIIVADTVTISRDVTLPDNGGRTTATFTVSGLVAFLAAMTAALTGRDKPKDAYDIVWIIENWPGGPAAAAQVIHTNPAYRLPTASAAFDSLFAEFATPERAGPNSYATFLAPTGAPRDERQRLARQAAGAVRELRTALERLT